MENLTKNTFKEKIFNYELNEDWKFEGDVPCLVDFYADWCGPCKIVGPILEKISEDYGDKINIYKVNVDEEEELSAIFGIRSIPSMLFCGMEGRPMMQVGMLPEKEIIKIIDEKLLN